jgi:hypothetical protein
MAECCEIPAAGEKRGELVCIGASSASAVQLADMRSDSTLRERDEQPVSS